MTGGTKSQNGTLKRKFTSVVKRTEILYHNWQIESDTIPVTTENMEPFDTPHFQGGEEVGVGSLTFNLEAAVTDGQFSIQLNLHSIEGVNSKNEARLSVKVECLTNGEVFSDLESGDITMRPGEAFEWEDVISVRDLWSQVNGVVPENIIHFRTQISIVEDDEQVRGQPDQADHEGPVANKKIKKEDLVFLNDEMESDLIIHAGEVSFAVHKCMFKGASPVIYYKTKPSSSGICVTEIRLEHINQETTMAMLVFVYSQELPAYQDLGEISNLLLAADSLEMDQLKEACFNRLVELAEYKDEAVMKGIYNLVQVYGSNVVLKDVVDDYIQKNGVPGAGEEFQARAHRDDRGNRDRRDRHRFNRR